MSQPLEDQAAELLAVLLVESAEMGRRPEMVFFLQRVAVSS